MDLLRLIHFSEVRWDLAADILPTWVGMVFVVSFASCLDVAAISIDMVSGDVHSETFSRLILYPFQV